MRVGLVTVAYHEPRFIGKFLKHVPEWVDEKLVLVSTVPWQGEPEPGRDRTAEIAELNGAYVVQHDWPDEHTQRNAGQDWFFDMDWIITLDPDEFLTTEGWNALKEFLDGNDTADAFVCDSQSTYWKFGYRIDPREEYKQIIAVRPTVRFVDKRVVSTGWSYAPVELHHFSWARTDTEVLRKISHYSHASEMDVDKWYKQIWLNWHPKMEDLHPLTPPALKRAVPVTLPPELEKLRLWP